uniref:Uncharacterized protein n=1 Tax=Cacopsylla melanoneura TaxID=428564 RepID=A0A8D8ZAC7_9HEMI
MTQSQGGQWTGHPVDCRSIIQHPLWSSLELPITFFISPGGSHHVYGSFFLIPILFLSLIIIFLSFSSFPSPSHHLLLFLFLSLFSSSSSSFSFSLSSSFSRILYLVLAIQFRIMYTLLHYLYFTYFFFLIPYVILGTLIWNIKLFREIYITEKTYPIYQQAWKPM